MTTPEALQPEHRRRESDALLLHIQALQGDMRVMDDKLTHHHAIFEERVEAAVERVYISAFPDGDPEGHRRHHELVIRREEERLKFWQEMRIAGAKWVGMGVLTFLVAAAWTQFLKGLHT